MTAYQGVEDRIAAFQAKADDFIGKPIVAAELLARIGVRLEYARLLGERTTMLQRLQTQQQLLLDLLNQLDIGILLLDSAGRIRFSNDTYGRMVALKPNELVGRGWTETALFSHKTREQIQQLLSAPPTRRSRLSLNWGTPDGRRLWTECEVKDNPSDPRERLLLFYDVSELYQLRESLSDDQSPHMIGTSRPMLELYRLIEDTARGNWTVLIEGETGTGKELVARSIHTASPRHKRPFIAVNSTGLSESLLSSPLFGHRRGAFTGALADQEEVFEAANGGTLFLDEIGDLPLSMQASLLRVLDQREIVRVGESRPRKVDIRIIAATHKALTTEMQAGRFRENLLFRLRVARIAVPPLRQRQSDIPLLVQQAGVRAVPIASGRGQKLQRPARFDTTKQDLIDYFLGVKPITQGIAPLKSTLFRQIVGRFGDHPMA
ncbi:MAG: sigma 54-interacting transcriptional regulator [Candidatus Competibacteraceae bacterium]